MDTPGRLNERPEDALRDLFRSEGALEAPSGLEERVMNRIALAKAPLSKEEALLPRWTWVLLAAAFVLPLFAPHQNTLKWPSFSTWIPALEPILRSPWILPTLLCATVLFGLEMWLSRRRSATTQH